MLYELLRSFLFLIALTGIIGITTNIIQEGLWAKYPGQSALK